MIEWRACDRTKFRQRLPPVRSFNSPAQHRTIPKARLNTDPSCSIEGNRQHSSIVSGEPSTNLVVGGVVLGLGHFVLMS